MTCCDSAPVPERVDTVTEMRIVILAAGVGSRLGNPFPKPLTVLDDGRSIMARQMDNLAREFGRSSIAVVVGFKKDMVMEAFPDVSFIYNQNFGETNTSKSLLKALQLTGDDPVLWLNGDVVFDDGLLTLLRPAIEADTSFVAVNTEQVGDEEVKYCLGADGFVTELSKSVERPFGEAVGINYVSSAHKHALCDQLANCSDDDYFERGIELAILHDRIEVSVVDVSSSLCIEVDFEDDLTRVNRAIGS